MAWHELVVGTLNEEDAHTDGLLPVSPSEEDESDKEQKECLPCAAMLPVSVFQSEC